MRWGLEQSRNLMTVHIANDTGMDRVVKTIDRVGIGKYEPYLSFALGAGETTVAQMVNAYAALANNGVQFNGLINLPNAGVEPTCQFADMAKAAGYQTSQRIDNPEALAAVLPKLLKEPGAHFVELVIEADDRRIGAQQPQPLLPEFQFVRMRHAVKALKATLAA